MERLFCNSLQAEFDLEKLGVVKSAGFKKNGIIVEVKQQNNIRNITLLSEDNISASELYNIFSSVERLLMIFDGRFYKLNYLTFESADLEMKKRLDFYSKKCFAGRLTYYNSADYCRHSLIKVIDLETVFTSELYDKWKRILTDLDIVHQMYLYSICNIKTPIDINCGFMIELTEAMVEVVNLYKHDFSSYNPGEKGTSLKTCIDAIIKKYGVDIFEKELSSNYDDFLQVMVDSRVRIMHIKRKHNKIYFNGEESLLYIQKLMLLYRKVLFDLLDIDESIYTDNIKKVVRALDDWNGVRESLFHRMNNNA